MKIFEPAGLGSITLKNRLIRSATFEGMADDNGFPSDQYSRLYENLARNNIGGIITGFIYVGRDGKAIQPGQAGMDSDEKINHFRRITEKVHQYDCRIFLQISHTGRQTSRKAVGGRILGISSKKSPYFNVKPEILTHEELERITGQYGDASLRAKEAGFDGVQVHAAHGYLLHQSILPSINNRRDEFGVDVIGTRLLDKIIDNIRSRCGNGFPLLVKVSGSDDLHPLLSQKQFEALIQFLDRKKVTGVEVSYGTMDFALNIFRGSSIPLDTILSYNPRYLLRNNFLRKLWKFFAVPLLTLKIKPFKPLYNLPYSIIAKQNTDIPVISVGGFRNGLEIEKVLEEGSADFAGICRPFICEPGFANKILEDKTYQSRCINCNICTVMCDSEFPTRCYFGKCP